MTPSTTRYFLTISGILAGVSYHDNDMFCMAVIVLVLLGIGFYLCPDDDTEKDDVEEKTDDAELQTALSDVNTLQSTLKFVQDNYKMAVSKMELMEKTIKDKDDLLLQRKHKIDKLEGYIETQHEKIERLQQNLS